MAYYPARPEQRTIIAELRAAARASRPRATQRGAHKRRGGSIVDARAVLNGGPLPRTYARKVALSGYPSR